MPDRPNVLFVFSDQHRGMDLGCAGNADVQTPAMDRLAREGVQCPNAYANAPVCTPSRATLLTGQYPTTHGAIANDVPLPVDAVSVAEVFREAGYRTGYIGKWHLDGVPRDRFTPPGPRRQGFDDFWAAFNCSHAYYDARYYRDSPEPLDVEGYEPVAQTDLALDFITRDDERPFCLFLSYGPPHAPYDQVPQEYRDRYDPAEIQVRPNAEPIPSERTGLADGLDPRETLANYYAQVTAIDDQLGRLLDALDEGGLARNTITAYASDHGDMLWSHGQMKKEQPWEESVNVPFLLRYPDDVPSGVADALVGLVDAAPTLLSLAGVEVPASMEGTDLTGVFRGGPGDSPDSVFLSHVVNNGQADSQRLPVWRGVRTERYTYARLRDGTPWLLYDNETDPYQFRNRALDAEYAEVRNDLDDRLDDWLARTEDPFVTGEEHLVRQGLVEEWNAQFEWLPWLDDGKRIDPGEWDADDGRQ